MSSNHPDGAVVNSGALNYSIPWVERTFRGRAVTETLLAPERDAGRLSSNDYESAVAFFSHRRRYYPYAGALLPIPFLYLFRKPSWTDLRFLAFMTTASFTGYVAGQLIAVRAHMEFVRSIENPDGFSQAIENIRQNVGSTYPPGPTIVRQFVRQSASNQASDFPNAALSNVNQSSDLPSVPPTAQPAKPVSRWDEIRAANAPSAMSSWDTIRQSHEKARIAALKGQSEDNPHTDRIEPRWDDRTDDQAQFDALLEKERNARD